MLKSADSHILSTEGSQYPLRSLDWSGLPILDVGTVQADYGHLLVLTSSGALHGVNLDSGDCVELCDVALPAIEQSDNHFGTRCHRLHVSSDGSHAAIVVDYGRTGVVVAVRSGALTMHLNGGDYHENTVPFSACFLRHAPQSGRQPPV
jgi:WD40 repeat protein